MYTFVHQYSEEIPLNQQGPISTGKADHINQKLFSDPDFKEPGWNPKVRGEIHSTTANQTREAQYKQ